MSILNQSIDERLLAANVAIDNAISDEEINGLLAGFGYNSEKLSSGKALYDSAQLLNQQQKTDYGDQFAATEELNQEYEEANKEYMRQVKVARVALKNDYAAFLKLGLEGQRKRTLSSWLVQARQFYNNALADTVVLEKLAVFGITQEKLQAAKQAIDDVEAANARQKKEKGEAQQATKSRDSAMDNLDDWISDFIAISRIALEDKPQLLEKMGVVEPS